MILPFIPEMFTCATCGTRCPVDLLCASTFQTTDYAWCVSCCGCEAHRPGIDPGGQAVFAVQAGKLTWRGLHDSPSRARRHH